MIKLIFLALFELILIKAVISLGAERTDLEKRDWLCSRNGQREEHLWELYDNTTQKCYPPRSQGPCQSVYSSFVQTNLGSEYGRCSCLKVLLKSPKLNRPLAMGPSEDNCYPLYEQGPCKDGEWLVTDGIITPTFPDDEPLIGVCMKNSCSKDNIESKNDQVVNTTLLLQFLDYEYYSSREDFTCSDIEMSPAGLHPLDINKQFWFIYENKCFKTFTRGPCEDGQLIVFEGTRSNPGCYDPITKFTVDLKPITEQIHIKDQIIKESRLCPVNEFQNEFNWQQLYDNATEKCYAPWTKGPCNGTFRYFSQTAERSEIGTCRNISPLNKFQKLSRPVAESVADGELYLVYSQGNCKDGEWIVFDENWNGICKKNSCDKQDNLNSESSNEVNLTQLIHYLGYEFYNSYEDFTPYDIETFPFGHPLDINKPFWFPYKGNCYKYFSQGPCGTGEVFVFKGLNPVPTCYNPNVVYNDLTGASNLQPSFSPTLSGYKTCAGNMIGDKCVPQSNDLP